MIIAARIPKLRDRIRHESSIEMDSLRPEVFFRILDYAYNARTPFSYPSDHVVCGLYDAACQLELRRLKDVCIQYMNATSDNVGEMLAVAKKWGDDRLLAKTKNRLRELLKQWPANRPMPLTAVLEICPEMSDELFDAFGKLRYGLPATVATNKASYAHSKEKETFYQRVYICTCGYCSYKYSGRAYVHRCTYYFA